MLSIETYPVCALRTIGLCEISQSHQANAVLCRFVKNNLLVEITSNAKLSRLFGWLLKRHSIVSYSLYTAGTVYIEVTAFPAERKFFIQ